MAGKDATSIADSSPKQDIQKDDLYLKAQKEIRKLKNNNRSLKTELEKQKQLTAKLQLSLLEKHTEINRLLAKNDHLVSEFVRNKKQLRNRRNKVETARLLAEVAATIEMTKDNNSNDASADTIARAEQYLSESQIEVDNENYEGASYLASQALDLIRSVQLRNGSKEKQRDETEITFLTHLPMKLLENSNVREEPSVKAKIKHVEKAERSVTAVGYKGLWVKVKLEEDEYGWIHYSLLSSANK